MQQPESQQQRRIEWVSVVLGKTIERHSASDPNVEQISLMPDTGWVVVEKKDGDSIIFRDCPMSMCLRVVPDIIIPTIVPPSGVVGG